MFLSYFSDTTMQSMKLTEELYKSFKVAKVFRENTDRINCLDFSVNGESMIASSNDDSIVVYCCLEGKYVVVVELVHVLLWAHNCIMWALNRVFPHF